jgi:hypothetical protein
MRFSNLFGCALIVKLSIHRQNISSDRPGNLREIGNMEKVEKDVAKKKRIIEFKFFKIFEIIY